MRACSLLLIMLLCWLQLSQIAVAQPVAIDVIYTGNEGGVTGMSVTLEESNLFTPPDWELGDFSLDLPAYRQGRYVMLDPEGHLSTGRFRRFFQQGPVRVEDGTPATMADSNYCLQLQWPPLKKNWAVEGLLKLNGNPPRFPDLFEKAATVMPVVNAAGDRLWLIRNDGKPRYRLADLGLPGLVETAPASTTASDQAAGPTASDTPAQAMAAAGASDGAAEPAAAGGSDAHVQPGVVAGRSDGHAQSVIAGGSDSPAQPGSDSVAAALPTLLWGDLDLSAPERWEPVLAGQAKVRHAGQETRWLIITKQLGTWDRRVAMIRRALNRRPGALLVGTGNSIDKPRAITSPEARRQSLEALEELPYTAFLPAAAEFSLGLAEFRRFSHTMPLVAANVVSPDPEINLPPYRIVNVGNRKVAIVGVVDREALRDAGVARMDSGWKVNDPVATLRRTVEELRKEGIQTIIVVTDLAYRDLSELRDTLEDVTLFVGGGLNYPSDLGLQREIDFDNASLARVRYAPLVVSPRPFRIGAVRVTVDEDSRRAFPVAIRHQSWRIDTEEPGDMAFAWKAAELREATQMEREYPLLPDVKLVASAAGQSVDPGQIYYSSRQWTRLAAGLVREAHGAEVVVLPVLRQFWNVAGAIPAYMVEGWLAGEDRLLRVTLTGAQLQQLADLDARHDGVVMAGYDPAVGKVNGTDLTPEERYRVIVSDRVLGNPRFVDVFGKEPQADETLGVLKPLVMGRLEAMRRTVPGYPETMAERLRRWMHDDGSRLESRLTVNFEEIGVNLLSYQNMNQAPYSKVRNTRINTPENSTWGTQGRLAINYASEWISWTGRVRAAYQQLRFNDQIQENADDLVLTSDLRFTFWTIPVAKTALQITPYLFGSYDTEFTPSEDPATKQPNPQQRDFDGIAGLVTSPGNGWTDLKVGTIARYDAVANVVRPGLQLASTFEREINSDSHVRLKLSADLRQYFTVAEPTPDQLGFLGDLSASVIVPIWQNLNLTVGANALVYRGQAGSDPWGVSFNPTVGLSYGGVWKPAWGLVF